MAQKSKHTPERTCVGCREKRLQSTMIRFVRAGAGWKADPAGERNQGRGCYLCSADCVKKAAKNRRYPGLASAAQECGLISSYVKNDDNIQK